MTTFRSFIIKKTVVPVVAIIIAVIAIGAFTTGKVRDIYRQNLIHLTNMLKEEIELLLETYNNPHLIKAQLSETVSQIPELKGIYVRFHEEEITFPEEFKREVETICGRKKIEKESLVVKDNIIVVCVPIREEFATSFMEPKIIGTFVAFFTNEEEEKLVASWLTSTILLLFLIMSASLIFIASTWGEIDYNFSKVERLITFISTTLEKGISEKERRIVRKIISSFTLREFKELSRLLWSLTERILELTEEIKRLAIIDPLTQLFNRNYLKIFVREKLIPMWKREGFPLSVAMLDLDNFKWINDTFGHQKGDEILKKWGEIIRKELRSSDVPIRYGGEEVLIIFPYTLKEEAAGAIERIREKLQQIDFGIGRKVNFSAGIACYPEDIREACFDDLILIADERLYAAKRSGKGKTVISDEEAEE